MNSHQGPQDPLEERMRRALHDDRWRLSVDDGMVERIHAGAARRRRRRQAGTVLAAVALVASGGGLTAYVAGSLNGGFTTTASDSSGGRQANEPAEAQTKARPEAEDETEADGDRPGRSSPERPEAEQHDKATANTLTSVAVPADFEPASFTATGPDRFWLLGATDGRAAVALTEDGGQTFGMAGRIDARVAGDQTTDPGTVHDIRFADDTNGWAYGGALFATHDGGRTWSRSTAVPGEVRHLEAGDGQAYALARSGEEWSAWHSTAGGDGWSRLDVELNDPAGLAITESSVVITDRSRSETFALVAELGGGDFESRPTPCVPSLSGGVLSAGGGSVWLKCPTGTAAAFSYSTDDGRTWNDAEVPGAAASNTASVVAARTPDEAVVATPGQVREATGDAGDSPETTRVGALGTPVFAGFTTPDVGYVLDLSGRLFRTTDAGDTWSRVQVS